MSRKFFSRDIPKLDEHALQNAFKLGGLRYFSGILKIFGHVFLSETGWIYGTLNFARHCENPFACIQNFSICLAVATCICLVAFPSHFFSGLTSVLTSYCLTVRDESCAFVV